METSIGKLTKKITKCNLSKIEKAQNCDANKIVKSYYIMMVLYYGTMIYNKVAALYKVIY